MDRPSAFGLRSLSRQKRAAAHALWVGPLVGGLALLALWGVALPRAAAHPAVPAAAWVPGIGRVAPSTVMTNGWTNLFPRLNAVSAVSSSEAWAVGEYGHLIHYAGGAWTAVDPPVLQGANLWDINMASASRGWAVAYDRAFEYDGSAWTEQSAGLGGQGYRVTRVAAAGPNDAWGLSMYNQYTSSILHWDGTRWNAVSIPATADWYDVALANPTDGWAVGYYSGAVVLHYDGTAWTPISGPPDPSLQSLQGISADAPGDAWFFGPADNGRAKIYHYQNGTWSWWYTPDGSSPNAIYAPSATECWVATDRSILHWDGTIWSVAVAGGWYASISGAPGQTWAVGMADTVLGRAGSGPWVRQQSGPTTQDLSAVSMLDPGAAWAVGRAGTILHYDGAWQVVTSIITADLYTVQMLSPGEGYAAGSINYNMGLIARWDGLAWTPVLTTTAPVYGLSMTGSGAGWAVGANGSIWRAVGGIWTQVSSPTPFPLHGVAFDSPTHGWAVGTSGGGLHAHAVLLEYVSSAWVDRSSSVSSQVGALSGIALAPGGQTGFMVGRTATLAGDALLRLANGSWTLHPPTGGDIPYAVALDSANTAWSVGNDVWTHRYDGNAWQILALPIGYIDPYPPGSFGLGGLALVPGSAGWAVGGSGTILRYSPPAPPPSATPTASPAGTATGTATTIPTPSPTSPPSSTPTPVNTLTSTPPPTNPPGSTPSPTNPPSSTAMPPSATPHPPSSTPVPPSATPHPPSSTPPPPPATATPCALAFADVHPGDYFATPVQYLACHGVISGYADGTFRPYNQTTRSQQVKIVVLGFALPVSTPAGGAATFADVPPTFPFFAVIETAAGRGIVAGYACGGPGEPCDAQQRPYFRPYANVTRGQLAKIAVLGAGWALLNPAPGSFADVLPGSTFYAFVETAVCHGIISGYACGGPGEPCDGQQRPYFRQYNPATRGQIAKIIYLSVSGNGACAGPATR